MGGENTGRRHERNAARQGAERWQGCEAFTCPCHKTEPLGLRYLLLLTEPPERSRRGSAERSGDNEAGAARAFRRRRDALTDRKE